jgi:hypothetical protein
MKEFRRLIVWEKAHALTLAVYRETASFPKEEIYGVTPDATLQRLDRGEHR